MRRSLIALGALAILPACAPPPSVTAFNGDSVTVRTVLSGRTALADQEAVRLCRRAGRETAEFLSSRGVEDTFDQEHLYACLNLG